jgi:hypothetical protein
MISHWVAATTLILLVAAGMAIAWQFRKNAKLGADISGPGSSIDGSQHSSDSDASGHGE